LVCAYTTGFEEREHIEAILKAIERKGALSHTIVHGVFIGPARSGKNSLMENLLGQTPPSKSPSTGIAEAVVQVQVEKLNTVAATVDKGSIWSRIDDNDEVIRLISMYSDSTNVQYEQDNSAKKFDNDTPLEILTRAIENKGLDGLQKAFDTSWSLYLSNTGGQIEFQEILPLLVSGPCVFFYTFRLDRDLNEHYTIEYELQDGTKLGSYKSTLTTIEGIQRSLASIAAMGIFVYRGCEKRKVQLRPKVFFIGTHSDLLPSNSAESIIAEKDKYLQECTNQFADIIEFASSSQMIFTVDNFSEDKSSFQKIRSTVEHAVKRHEFEMVCPSHWLIFSFALRRFEQETVSYEECIEVAKQCGIVDTEELNDALHFIHTKMGLIRYFPHEYINDIVVVKPQLLYDKISELIVKTFTFDKAGKPAAEQFENGIFTLHEFERICRRSGEGSMKAPQFAKLLEKLRITAPLERIGDQVTKYFIPCVLARAAKANDQFETQSTEIPQLVITFKCRYCPQGLRGALISYLMANLSDFEWKLLTDCIFRDQVAFKVGPLADKIIVKFLSTHLVVSCVPNRQVQDRNDFPVDNVCIEVRRVIEAGIKQIVADIDFIDSKVEHSLTFLCPCDECLNQCPAKMKYLNGERFRLHCNKTDECPNLPQGYEKWFTTKSQRQSATV
jgi:GTPase SAR1 family protein